jgi:uncharacterized protein YkwD
MVPPHARLVAAVLAATLLSSTAPAHASSTVARRLLRAINATRSVHHLGAVRPSRTLAGVARRHSEDMVVHQYFSHETRNGLSSVQRIAGTGLLRGRARWETGEVLAWHAGPARPRAIVRAWLNSPPHRYVLLRSTLRAVGIGIARGTPTRPRRGGTTYTVDFSS